MVLRIARDFGSLPHEIMAMPASKVLEISRLYSAEASVERKRELEHKAREAAENGRKKSASTRRYMG